jgi:hypothetical protein
VTIRILCHQLRAGATARGSESYARKDMPIPFRFPFLRVTLDSPLSLDAARAALQKRVQTEELTYLRSGLGPRGLDEAVPFRGTLAHESFEIMHRVRYQNRFVPLIRGVLKAQDAGTRVELTMRMWLGVSLFCGVWFGGLLLAAIALFYKHNVAGLVPLALMGLAALLVCAAFGADAVTAEEVLREIFAADIRNPPRQ